ALLAELAQVCPGVEPGIVTVVEGQADGVVADRVDGRDRNIDLAGTGDALVAAVALNLGRRTEDAQKLGRQLEIGAIVESDDKAPPVLLQPDLRLPGLLVFAHGRVSPLAAPQ